MSGYYDEDEVADVYSETRRRARKEHECSACRETVSSGHTYYVISVVFDGGVSNYKRCARCQAIHLHLRTLGDRENWPMERLDCGHLYQELWESDPPPEIAALAFALPGEIH